jgi:hypothetical protein
MRIVRSAGRRKPAWLKCTLLLLAGLASALHAQETGKRVALVIGNDAYSISPLKNAINDARAMDQALKSAGFQTILLENARKADMDRVIGEFLDKLGPDDTALFFYAGHGVQIENENFLVPVDFPQVATISAAKFACMSVAQIFDELKRKRAKRNIVILDACRSNPVATKYSLEAGLAKPQDAPKEVFVAFSTGPGQTAADNPNGRNSWFTEALADYISQAGLTVEINEMFTRVKKRVSDATEGRQTPWTTSNLTASFYFHQPLNADAENDSTLTQKWMADVRVREQREEWSEAIDLVNQVLQKHPGGAIEELAGKRMPYLTARKLALTRFQAGDYAAAASAYEQALKLDPFAADAALQGVNSYLLQDRLPEAIALLKTMRLRGTSDAVQTAVQMLQQLAAVSPEAAKEAKASPPQPPPIEELLSDTHFGVPDWDAGHRHLQTASVNITRWTGDLKMEVPMPVLLAAAITAPPPAAADSTAQASATALPDQSASAQAATVSNAIFHVEVVPTAETRNLRLRNDDSGEFGYVQFDGPGGETPVVFEGQQLVLPAKLKLPAGKYEIRTVDQGKVVSEQDLEVAPLSMHTIQVKRP